MLLQLLMKPACFAIALAVICISPATASETITPEPDGSVYHFVTHYAVQINSPASAVWDQLIDIGSWMYDFDLLHESGNAGQEGDVRRLYAGQEFFIEITKVIPGQLLVFANLPARFNGEYSTGVTVITLDEADGTTTVNLTMSRRYSWDSKEPNPQRSMRESRDFQERTRAMWQDRFLGRLRSLVEDG